MTGSAYDCAEPQKETAAIRVAPGLSLLVSLSVLSICDGSCGMTGGLLVTVHNKGRSFCDDSCRMTGSAYGCAELSKQTVAIHVAPPRQRLDWQRHDQ